jgi:hypothetical protein
VSQASTVARLATRELWMTFRLLLVLIVAVGAGAVVGLLPTTPAQALARLAAGLGAAIGVAAAVAAWSLSEERVSGRAGWLVTRSVGRGTYLVGWFGALALIAATGLVAGAVLGWLSVASTAAVDATEYASAIVAVAATLVVAVAAGLLAGTLLRPPAAMIVTVVVCAAVAAAVVFVPDLARWLPGGGLALLAGVAGPDASAADALRAAGIGLGIAAVALVIGRLAFERADL